MEDALNGIIKCNGLGTYSAVTDNSTNWDLGYYWRLTTAWGTSPITTSLTYNTLTVGINAASSSSAGSMSAADKIKLDNIASGANLYIHPTGDGYSHIPATGTSNNGKILMAGSTANSFSWQVLPTQVYPGSGIAVSNGSGWGSSLVDNHSNWDAGYSYRVTSATGTSPLILTLSSNQLTGSIAAVTTSSDGIMTATDKIKLNGIATNANYYIHPSGDGNLHVPATGTSNNGKVLTAGSTAGSLSWQTSSGGGGSTAQTFQTLTSSISITFNITTSRNANLTLAHDAGLTVSNPVNGDIPACLIVTPNSSTDHTLTFPSNYFCNGHSNIFTIEHGTGIVYCFTLRYNGSITIVDYATYSN